MSRNYVEIEQELIADLAHRTGRDLAQWMVAIEAAGLTEKNAIIDWLRPQGFTFANASWIERIHHNGGRPIYPPPHAVARTAQPSPASMPQPIAPRNPPLAGAADPAQLGSMAARGKAFRPLAELLIAEIRRALPDVIVAIDADLVVFARPHPLAVLAIGPRELRLGLDLGDWPFDAEVVKARMAGASPRITHMTILTDARRISPPLLDLVRHADSRANPPPPGA